jgi:hypothetical protein
VGFSIKPAYHPALCNLLEKPPEIYFFLLFFGNLQDISQQGTPLAIDRDNTNSNSQRLP